MIGIEEAPSIVVDFGAVDGDRHVETLMRRLDNDYAECFDVRGAARRRWRITAIRQWDWTGRLMSSAVSCRGASDGRH